MNPYHVAAVAKAQRLRALRLPPAQPEGFIGSAGVDAFLEATAQHRWAGKNGSMKQLARRLTDAEITSLLAWYRGHVARDVARMEGLGAPECIMDSIRKGPKAIGVLERVMAERTK